MGTTNLADLYAYSNRIALSSFIRSSYVFSVRCPIPVGSESTHCESGPKHILSKSFMLYLFAIATLYIILKALIYSSYVVCMIMLRDFSSSLLLKKRF